MPSDVWWGRKLKTSHCLHVVITQLWADSRILLSWVLWSCDGMGEMRQVKRLGKKGRPLGWQRSEFTQGWKCRAQRTILDHRHWNTTFPSVTRQLWFKTSKENQWKGFRWRCFEDKRQKETEFQKRAGVPATLQAFLGGCVILCCVRLSMRAQSDV